MAKRRQAAPPVAARGGDPAGSAPIGELDRVRLLSAVLGDDDQCIPAGSTGTVVGIYAGGDAFEVEFTQPFDALATVDGRSVVVIERGGA